MTSHLLWPYGKLRRMDFSSLSRPAQYAIIFVLSGTVAVVIKMASELEESRVAGLVAMVPMKILIAWTIIGAAAGSRGIASSTSGMFMGLAALLIAIASVRWLSAHLAPTPLICSGLGVWCFAAATLEWAARALDHANRGGA